LTRAFTALESGLSEAVDFDKPSFRGREALLRQQETGIRRRLVRLQVQGQHDFDAMGQEPVRQRSGEIVGRTTSGGFGHTLRMSLTMAYLSIDAIKSGADLEIKLMNEWFPANILSDVL
jgi:dimethylglycine dehydrogenase